MSDRRKLAVPLAFILATLACAAASTPSAWAQRRRAAPQPPAPVDTSSQPDSGEEINLAVGETRTISARDVRNYSEGVPGVIDIKLTTDNQSFVLNGRKPGSTTLLLIKNDGSQITLNINVFLRSPQAVERELNQLLDGMPGVRVKRVGAHIVIDGTVAGEAELKRVQQVAALYPGQVEALVNLAGHAGAAVAVFDDKKYIIRMDIYFVQFDRTTSSSVGLGWPASVGGDAIVSELSYDFLAGVTQTATVGLTNQPMPRLDVLARRGFAKVLKQATVVTNNGVEASFRSGGEQLFTANTGLTVGIQRVEYGADVAVLPRYNPKTKDPDVKLSADMSELTAPVAGTPLPARQTSRLSTNVSLKLGQCLVLSGIRSRVKTRTTTGLPLLSDIPILGALFGSTTDSEIEQEGAIFIVPSVVESLPTRAREMVELALKRFGTYSGNLQDHPTYDARPGGSLLVPGMSPERSGVP